ncbi:hypothetical protein [Paenibacillus sp. QZ-Y1]|uniref:hypothetical protein n=1 Tax=Paenibacillus sp. QZ-Y1 TaxID=3414511 RepID=UPI003F7AFA9B
MRKNSYLTSAMLLLLTCTVLLTGCDNITAQNITNTGSAQGMNGGGMMGGGPGMNGGTQRGGGNGMGMNGRTGGPEAMQGMMNADLTGRVISATDSTVTIALLEVQDNSPTGSNNGRQLGASRGGSMDTDMKDTGIQMKLNISNEVNITKGMGMDTPGNDSSANSTIQVSDLKEGDIVMVWYKDNTEAVARMVVVQS